MLSLGVPPNSVRLGRGSYPRGLRNLQAQSSVREPSFSHCGVSVCVTSLGTGKGKCQCRGRHSSPCAGEARFCYLGIGIVTEESGVTRPVQAGLPTGHGQKGHGRDLDRDLEPAAWWAFEL